MKEYSSSHELIQKIKRLSTTSPRRSGQSDVVTIGVLENRLRKIYRAILEYEKNRPPW